MPTNFDLAKPVSDSVQLLSVTLRDAIVESYFDPLHVPEALALGMRHSATYELDEAEERILNVTLEFEFLAQENGDHDFEDVTSSEEYVARVQAHFLLLYQVDEKAEFSEQHLQCFSELNGPFNAWPYWRELVQTATGRIGLSGITIPVYRTKKHHIGPSSQGAKSVGTKKKARKKKK